MSKPDHIAAYTPETTELVEQVLIEVWSRLGSYHEHLVLVGGLTPRYIVPQTTAVEKHCGTLDVDLGVSLGLQDTRAYQGIRSTLMDIGFQQGTNRIGNLQQHSFVLKTEQAEVVVDFLTTTYGGPEERVRAIESELSALQTEGLGLALIEPELVPIQGKAIFGGTQQATLRVCRPIPFVVLKSLAFQNRRAGKDVNDLVYILRERVLGTTGLRDAIRREEREALAFQSAIQALKNNFADPRGDGPVRYAHFHRDNRPRAAEAFAAVQEFLQQLAERDTQATQ